MQSSHRSTSAPPTTLGEQRVAVSTAGLTKRYQARVAVEQMDLTVYQGDIYGLLGPNGAGKTTIIGMLLGLVFPSAGRCSIWGCDVSVQRVQALRHVGAMIEAPAFYPFLSGRDNLRVLGGLRGPLGSKRIDIVLQTVGLARRAADRYRTYSLGMKQRLAIGLALLHDPPILILDEPTNGLDPRGVVEIRTLIGRLAGQGHTIILCTHLLHEVEQVCNRVAIIREGRLIVQDDMKTLMGKRDLEALFLELTED